MTVSFVLVELATTYFRSTVATGNPAGIAISRFSTPPREKSAQC